MLRKWHQEQHELDEYKSVNLEAEIICDDQLRGIYDSSQLYPGLVSIVGTPRHHNAKRLEAVPTFSLIVSSTGPGSVDDIC